MIRFRELDRRTQSQGPDTPEITVSGFAEAPPDLYDLYLQYHEQLRVSEPNWMEQFGTVDADDPFSEQANAILSHMEAPVTPAGFAIRESIIEADKTQDGPIDILAKQPFKPFDDLLQLEEDLTIDLN